MTTHSGICAAFIYKTLDPREAKHWSRIFACWASHRRSEVTEPSGGISVLGKTCQTKGNRSCGCCWCHAWMTLMPVAWKEHSGHPVEETRQDMVQHYQFQSNHPTRARMKKKNDKWWWWWWWCASSSFYRKSPEKTLTDLFNMFIRLLFFSYVPVKCTKMNTKNVKVCSLFPM